ncbi:MAG: hypothetical protein ACPL7B_05860 [Candidatus Poribacteria bacterium]
MQVFGIIYVAALFLLSALLTIGGYFIQRDKYWTRIWEELGKPNVKNIKELKIYIQNQPNLASLRKFKGFDLKSK